MPVSVSESESEEEISTRPCLSPESSYCLLNTETGQHTGRYSGRTHHQAAVKCFIEISSQTEDLPDNFEMYIRQIDSPYLICRYRCSRIRLDRPKRIKVSDGSYITYPYRNRIYQLKVPYRIRNKYYRIKPEVIESPGSKSQPDADDLFNGPIEDLWIPQTNIEFDPTDNVIEI